jgi:diketogulonate reductase-like aldo/keto reductase
MSAATWAMMAAGVSNFGLSELQQLLSLAKVHPSVVESRSDPFAISHHVIQWALSHNMTFIGYSSLGTQWVNSPVSVNPVFDSKLLQVGRN